MKIFLICDLHLRHTDEMTKQKFVNFLKKISSDKNILFILGDFFDFWFPGIEKKLFLYKELLKEIRSITIESKLKIYYIIGNRDFLFDKHTAEKYNIHLLPHSFILGLDNKKIYLTHGDSLTRKDIFYELIRKTLQNSVGTKILNIIPFGVKFLLTKQMRYFSRNSLCLSPNLKRVLNIRKIKGLSSLDIFQIICGHFHLPYTVVVRHRNRKIHLKTLATFEEGFYYFFEQGKLYKESFLE